MSALCDITEGCFPELSVAAHAAGEIKDGL